MGSFFSCPIINKGCCERLHISGSAYQYAVRRLDQANIEVNDENIKSVLFSPGKLMLGDKKLVNKITNTISDFHDKLNSDNLSSNVNGDTLQKLKELRDKISTSEDSSVLKFAEGSNVLRIGLVKNAGPIIMALQGIDKKYYSIFTDDTGKPIIVFNEVVGNSSDILDPNNVANNGLDSSSMRSIVYSESGMPFYASDYLKLKYSRSREENGKTYFDGSRSMVSDSSAIDVATQLYRLKELGAVVNFNVSDSEDRGHKITYSRDINDNSVNIDVVVSSRPGEGTFNVNIKPQIDDAINALNEELKQIREANEESPVSTANLRDKSSDVNLVTSISDNLFGFENSYGGHNVSELLNALTAHLNITIKSSLNKENQTRRANGMPDYVPSQKELASLIEASLKVVAAKANTVNSDSVITAFINEASHNKEAVLLAYNAKYSPRNVSNDIFGEELSEMDDEDEYNNTNDLDSNPFASFVKDSMKHDFGEENLDESIAPIFEGIISGYIDDVLPVYYEPSRIIGQIKAAFANASSVKEAFDNAERMTLDGQHESIKTVLDRINKSPDSQRVMNRVFAKMQNRTFSVNEVRISNSGEVKSVQRANKSGYGYKKAKSDISPALTNLKVDDKQTKFDVTYKLLTDFNNTFNNLKSKYARASSQDQRKEILAKINQAVHDVISSYSSDTVPQFNITEGDIESINTALKNLKLRSNKPYYWKNKSKLSEGVATMFSCCYKTITESSPLSYNIAGKEISGVAKSSWLQDVFNEKISSMSKDEFAEHIQKVLPSEYYMYKDDNGNLVFNNHLLQRLYEDDSFRKEFSFVYMFAGNNEYMKDLTPEQLLKSEFENFRTSSFGKSCALCPLPMQSVKKSWNSVMLPIFTGEGKNNTERADDIVRKCSDSLFRALVLEAKFKKSASNVEGLLKNKNASFLDGLLNGASMNDELRNAIDSLAEDFDDDIADQIKGSIDELLKRECVSIAKKLGFLSYDKNDFDATSERYIENVVSFTCNTAVNNVWLYSMCGVHPSLYKSQNDAFKRMAGAHNTGERLAAGTEFHYIVLPDIKGILSEISAISDFAGLKDINITDGQGFDDFSARQLKTELGGQILRKNSVAVDDAGVPVKPVVYGMSTIDSGVGEIKHIPYINYFKYSESQLTDGSEFSFGTLLNNLLYELNKDEVQVHGVVFDSCVKCGESNKAGYVKDAIEKEIKAYNEAIKGIYIEKNTMSDGEKEQAKRKARADLSAGIVNAIKNALVKDINGKLVVDTTKTTNFDSSQMIYVTPTNDHYTNKKSVNVSTQFLAVFTGLSKEFEDRISNLHGDKEQYNMAKSLLQTAARANNIHNAIAAMFNGEQVTRSTLFMLEDKIQNAVSFAKKASKFHTRGGHLYQISTIEADDLSIKVDKDNRAIQYAEVEIPLPKLEGFEEYIDENGDVDMNLLLAEHPEYENYRVIAYRTPTGGFNSIMPCKVKKFLSPLHSGVMHCPKEITMFMGSDHDGDSLTIINSNGDTDEEFNSMWDVLTSKGSLSRYEISSFDKEYELAQNVSGAMGFASSDPLITPLGVSSRYESYEKVHFAQNALGIFAKQKSLANLAIVQDMGEVLPKYNISFKMLDGKVYSRDKFSPNGTTSIDGNEILKSLGAMVEAGSDVLTKNLFNVSGMTQENVNMFISCVRAGVPLEICFALTRSSCAQKLMNGDFRKAKQTFKNIISKIKSESGLADDEIAKKINSEIDSNPISVSMLSKTDYESLTLGEELSLLNFFSTMSDISMLHNVFDNSNAAYSQNDNLTSFFRFVDARHKILDRGSLNLKDGTNNIRKDDRTKWVKDITNAVYDNAASIFQDVPFCQDYLTVYDAIVNNTVQDKNGRKYQKYTIKSDYDKKRLINIIALYKALKYGFITQNSYESTTDRIVNQFDKLPESMKRFLAIDSESKNGREVYSIICDQMTPNERSIFTTSWAMLYNNPDTKQLALDLYRASIVKGGIFHYKNGYSDLIPLCIANDDDVKAFSDRIINDEEDVDAIISLARINNVVWAKNDKRMEYMGRYNLGKDKNVSEELDENGEPLPDDDLSKLLSDGGITINSEFVDPYLNQKVDEQSERIDEYYAEIGSSEGPKVGDITREMIDSKFFTFDDELKLFCMHPDEQLPDDLAQKYYDYISEHVNSQDSNDYISQHVNDEIEDDLDGVRTNLDLIPDTSGDYNGFSTKAAYDSAVEAFNTFLRNMGKEVNPNSKEYKESLASYLNSIKGICL